MNHNGLEQLEVLGEVGFGDMARILMRRRANDEAFRKLRDRFTFRVKEMSAIQTPDVVPRRTDREPAASGATSRRGSSSPRAIRSICR